MIPGHRRPLSRRHELPFGKSKKLFERAVFSLARPDETDRPHDVQIVDRNLPYGCDLDIGNNRNANPGRDKAERPVNIVGLGYHIYRCAARNKGLRQIAQIDAVWWQDEGLVAKVTDIERLLIRKGIIIANGERVGHLEKSPVCELSFILLDNGEDRIDFMCSEEPR